MRIPAAILALAIALLAASCKPKQDTLGEKSIDQINVEELTKTYFELMQNGHWDLIGTIFHPDSLREFRAMLDFLDHPAPYPALPQIRATIFGAGATEQTVAALADAAFFGTTLSFLMRETTEKGTLKDRQVDIIGAVPEGDELMHVVAKSHIPKGDQVYELLEIVSYRRDGNSWKVLLTGKMHDNLLRLRNQIETLGTQQPDAQQPTPPYAPAPPAQQ